MLLLQGRLFSKAKIYKKLMVCFTQCTQFFQKVCFLLPIGLPCVIWGSYARDHGILRDIFFCARQLRAKISSYSWQNHLQTIYTVCYEDDYFPKGKFKLFNSLFHSVHPIFPKSWFSIADLFAVRYLWVVCNEDKCCVVTQRAADLRVAWLVTFARIACLLQLWIKTSELDYSIWATPKW